MSARSPRPFFLPPATPVGPLRGPDLTDRPARIPTGVPDFDFLTGGIPAGSVVLLWGAAGAGHQEFAVTSAVHLMLHYDLPELHRFFLGGAKGPFVYPEGVVYVSTSRSRAQVLDELRSAFEGDYADTLARHLTFLDLSREYFAETVVPPAWSAVASPLLGGGSPSRVTDGGPLRALVDGIEARAGRQLVVVDSLTDLVVRRGVETSELLSVLKGLRRRAKEWGAVVYLLLSEGVAPPAVEQAVLDSVDGVLHFSWTTSPSHSSRQRTMLIEKFMSVLAHVPAEYHGRFVIRVGAK
ncbi:HTR-like protein, partial [mine drainage metagenome]